MYLFNGRDIVVWIMKKRRICDQLQSSWKWRYYSFLNQLIENFDFPPFDFELYPTNCRMGDPKMLRGSFSPKINKTTQLVSIKYFSDWKTVWYSCCWWVSFHFLHLSWNWRIVSKCGISSTSKYYFHKVFLCPYKFWSPFNFGTGVDEN